MTVETFTINDKEYFSYVSVQEIKDYYGLDPDHPILALSDAEIEVLAVGATRRIDLVHFRGCKENETQFTKWPRDPWGLPYDIELATILLLDQIRISPTAATPAGFNANIQRIRAGSVEVYFFEPDNKSLISEEFAIPDPTIRNLLKPYIAVSDANKGDIVTGAVFGNDGVSIFKDINRYHRGIF